MFFFLSLLSLFVKHMFFFCHFCHFCQFNLPKTFSKERFTLLSIQSSALHIQLKVMLLSSTEKSTSFKCHGVFVKKRSLKSKPEKLSCISWKKKTQKTFDFQRALLLIQTKFLKLLVRKDCPCWVSKVQFYLHIQLNVMLSISTEKTTSLNTKMTVGTW